MLLFSTIIPINDTLTPEKFITLVLEWNDGSKHPENIINNINWDGSYNTKFIDENKSLEIKELPSAEVVAVRYERVDAKGVVWDTDYIMNFKEMKMSIRLDRSYLEEAYAIDFSFSTPIFIKLLIDKGFVDKDFELQILRECHYINESNIDLLAGIIKNESHFSLPIVYVSKTFDNTNPLDVETLAYRLKGVAHVLVQENVSHNCMIREATNDRNEYKGNIGIYYPNNNFGHEIFLSKRIPQERRIDRLVEHVIKYGISQKTNELYTWSGVSEHIWREHSKVLKEARKKAESETEEIIAEFDDEFKEYEKRIEDLTNQNNALNAEIVGMRAKYESTTNVPLLFYGDENDFFAGEIKEFVLEAICEEVKRTQPGTRKEHVLKDVLENNESSNERSRRREEIKRLLTGCSRLNGSSKSSLKEIGIEVEEDSKHYKLSLKGDYRYCVTLAKTPSDTRGTLNAIKEMQRIMF